MKAGLVVVVLILALTGCAPATAPSPTASAPDGITYRDDPDLQRVWLADGVVLRSYEALHLEEPRAEVAKLNPDGVESLAWARTFLRDEIATALRTKGVFPVVTVATADLKPGMRVLRLDTTIIEYEKGGGGARFFAGLYGAGQPVIRVRGRVTDGDRQVFAFEARRSGDSALARMFGGYRSDRAIQEEDIRDLAQDLADFILRNGKP